MGKERGGLVNDWPSIFFFREDSLAASISNGHKRRLKWASIDHLKKLTLWRDSSVSHPRKTRTSWWYLDGPMNWKKKEHCEHLRLYNLLQYKWSIWLMTKSVAALTISLRMLISLKSMRFSSSSMWLFLNTFTALWAPDSLCTHILTSPKAPRSWRHWLKNRSFKKLLDVRETYLFQELCQFCRSRVGGPVCAQQTRWRRCRQLLAYLQRAKLLSNSQLLLALKDCLKTNSLLTINHCTVNLRRCWFNAIIYKWQTKVQLWN